MILVGKGDNIKTRGEMAGIGGNTFTESRKDDRERWVWYEELIKYGS